jgi:hypothetical protein
MKTFRAVITRTETYMREVDIEAEDFEQAEEMAEEMANDMEWHFSEIVDGESEVDIYLDGLPQP